MATPKDLPRDIGGFIRDLRHSARISLRQLAEQTGVSNPYLSQIERGLRKPSAEVLQQIASALRVSTPAMYLRAGLLDDREGQGVLAAIAADPDLTMAQRQSLSQIYETFRRENLRLAEATAGTTGPADAGATEPGTAGPTDTDTGPADARSTTGAGGVASSAAPPPATQVGPAADDPTEAVIESVAVTEAGTASAPARSTKPMKKTARKAVRKAAPAAEEEQS